MKDQTVNILRLSAHTLCVKTTQLGYRVKAAIQNISGMGIIMFK
jgi:hypothetical protein